MEHEATLAADGGLRGDDPATGDADPATGRAPMTGLADVRAAAELLRGRHRPDARCSSAGRCRASSAPRSGSSARTCSAPARSSCAARTCGWRGSPRRSRRGASSRRAPATTRRASRSPRGCSASSPSCSCRSTRRCPRSRRPASTARASRPVGPSVDEALRHAREYADRTGAVLIHPFDHEDVVAGQGTIALEIAEQVPDVATVAGAGRRGRAGGRGRRRARRAAPGGAGDRRAGRAAPPRTRRRWPRATRSPAPELRTMADGIAVGPARAPCRSASCPRTAIAGADRVRGGPLPRAAARSRSGPRCWSSRRVRPRSRRSWRSRADSRDRSSRSCPAATSTRWCSCGWSGTGSRPPAGSCSCGSGSTTRRAPSRRSCATWPRPGANVMDVSHARTGVELAVDEVAIEVQVETKGPDHCTDVRRGAHRRPGYRLT